MISPRLTERFGIRHPIVCAPMAFVTGGSFAAAVSRAADWESSVGFSLPYFLPLPVN
jgi:NAD(P)H-dependent flavin oxidoreductase YrpB (nitropropane dioxygenase family)